MFAVTGNTIMVESINSSTCSFVQWGLPMVEGAMGPCPNLQGGTSFKSPPQPGLCMPHCCWWGVPLRHLCRYCRSQCTTCMDVTMVTRCVDVSRPGVTLSVKSVRPAACLHCCWQGMSLYHLCRYCRSQCTICHNASQHC